MKRADLDHDGSGRPMYTDETEAYITSHAERLRITFADACEIYENTLYRGKPLHERPDPEPEDTP